MAARDKTQQEYIAWNKFQLLPVLMSKHVHNSHAYSVIIPKTENCCALGQKNFKLDGVGEGGGGYRPAAWPWLARLRENQMAIYKRGRRDEP